MHCPKSSLLFPNNMSWGSFCNFKCNLKVQVQVQEKEIPHPAEGWVNGCMSLLDNLLCLLKDAQRGVPAISLLSVCLREMPLLVQKTAHSSTSSPYCYQRDVAKLEYLLYRVLCRKQYLCNCAMVNLVTMPLQGHVSALFFSKKSLVSEDTFKLLTM